MRKTPRFLCLLLAALLFVSPAWVLTTNAEEPPLRMQVSTDKPSYGLRDTVRLHVQVDNTSERAYRDVAVVVYSADYGFPNHASNTMPLGTLPANETASADYSLIVSRQFGGLGFFQRLALFFRYLFKLFVQIKPADLAGKTYISQTLTISQNGASAAVDVYVVYGEAVTSTDPADPPQDPNANALFSLTMLDVGQGLSLLMKSDDRYMIYDGGGRSASSYVVAYLKAHGVGTLDYMVASHYDEDHIAGLVGVLNTTTVRNVYTPDYTADTAIYNSFVNKLSASGATEKHPSVGETFSFGNAAVQFISPANYAYSNVNSYSLAVRITCGTFSCIVTGDAEMDAEADMVAGGYAVDSDLLVVGHHGSASSSSAGFVQAVAPEYAFISVGAGNAYRHPAAQTLSTLQQNHVQIFRSDQSGAVTCYTDGEKYWFSADPSTDWTEGSYTLSYDANGGSGAPSVQSGAKTYTVSSVKPIRSGYTFLGWSMTQNAATASFTAGQTLRVSDNTILYAVWQKNPAYTLSYDANGGSGAPTAQTGSNSYTIPSVRPSRSGYTFLGWSKNRYATAADYSPGGTISLLQDTTLYAVWQKDPVAHRIYRTKTGKKYHYIPNCGNGTYYECTLEEALAAGLTPCEKCVHD